jgi:hypothetical protein
MARLGEVLGESRFTLSSAIGNAGVVAVSELVGTSHCLESVHTHYKAVDEVA